MKTSHLRRAAVCVAAASGLILAGCSGGSSGNRANRGQFKVNLISTGQGQIFPYRIRAVDAAGVPTDQIVNIESDEVLRAHAREGNGVLPVATFRTTATLPNGNPGNHFLLMEFSHELDVESILSPLLANATTNAGLTTAVNLVLYDPLTESTTVLPGRGFVNGITYYNVGGELVRTQAVTADDDGNVQIVDPRAIGFPTGFNGDERLVSKKSFVFVADSDGNLASFDTFPAAATGLIRIIVTNAVRNSDGRVLQTEACVATTVGSDPNPPDVLGWHPSKTLEISPGNGDQDVDPTTSIIIRFNKPVQPTEVGTFFASNNLTPKQGGIQLNVTAAAQKYNVIYHADPLTFGDLCSYRITPAYSLPGKSTVEVLVNATSIHGLGGQELGNKITTTFETGKGPGIINAPVAPDVVYVGIGGTEPGVAVIDLNGYGQGTNGLEPDPITGEPTKDPKSTHYNGNPNKGRSGVFPALSDGQGPLDAGSNGRLTLVEDTNGNTRLLGAPLIGQVADIHIGCPLDLVFNNFNVNVNASGANQLNPGTRAQVPGNNITTPPHPNPPKLRFPPPNVSRGIFGDEPTVASSLGPLGVIVTMGSVVGCADTANDLLTSGTVSDFAPHFFEGVFNGPQLPPDPPPPPPRFCPFTSRQQIGHFLYVLDTENDQILVLNSNRFTILDTIRLTDPSDIAFSPSLGLMAVTSFASSTVSFINTNPTSPLFHEVVAVTRVASGPTSVAWQPDGEAVLCVSPSSNSLSVISASDFSVLQQVSGNLNDPLDVVVTERYQTHGNLSGVYYAYILNRNGSVAVYESGPDGVNGIGFNDIIGTVGLIFRQAHKLTFDHTDTGLGSVYVSHVDETGVGQVSRLSLDSSPTGQLPTNQISSNGIVLPPTFRQKTWKVTAAFGGRQVNQARDGLSGNAPVDVAFDTMYNNAYLPNQVTPYSGQLGTSILFHSAKGTTFGGTGGVVTAYSPKFMFIALSDVGKIDVFEVDTRQKIKTIDVPGVRVLADYWRQ